MSVRKGPSINYVIKILVCFDLTPFTLIIIQLIYYISHEYDITSFSMAPST